MKKKAEGFSLLELMMVLACGALLITAAVPGISHMQNAWRLWGGARTLETSLQWARMRAIAENAPVLFMVDEGRQKFYCADPATGEPYSGSTRHLSMNLRVRACPRRPLRFYPHGNAAPAGTYTIEGRAGAYSIIVTPGGRIRIRKE